MVHNLRYSADKLAIANSPVYSNCERMFDVLGAHEADDAVEYYNAIWDETTPGLIAEVSTYKLEPTGARRRELRGPAGRGKFRESQFMVTESQNDAQQAYYAWLPTVASGALETPRIDNKALEEATSLRKLTGANVMSTLIKSAETLEDFVYLLRAAAEHGIKVDDELKKQTQRIGGRAILGILTQHWDNEIDKPEFREELGAVFNSLVDTDSSVTAALQGRVVTIILQSLPAKLNQDLKSDFADVTVDTLKYTLESGLLPHEPRIFNRFLLHPAVQQDPHFLKYLSGVVADKRYNRPNSRNILGEHREIIAHDFIAISLYTRSTELEESSELKTKLLSTLTERRLLRAGVKGSDSFVYLFALADSLGYIANSDRQADEILRDRRDYLMEFEEINKVFEYILSLISAEQPNLENDELDTLRLTSLRQILEPRVTQVRDSLHAHAKNDYEKWKLDNDIDAVQDKTKTDPPS